jgi:DNA-binding NtrC family response regulator
MWTPLRSYATLRTVNRATMSQRMMADPVDTVKARVLVVDDETVVSLATKALTKAGFETQACSNGNAALATVETGGADVVVCSMQMPGVDSMDLLRRMHARRPDVPVVMLGGDPSIHAAVPLIPEGAFDCVPKPFDDESLAAVVERALEMASLKRENDRLRDQLEAAISAAGFVAESPQSKQLVAMIRRAAPARSTALIEGESGTGKELVARMLHHWSKRANGPFVAVNCKAFADGVVESELFGHEKGSFTGAIAARAGCFERASGGTLFLDEIAEAGPDFQAKLLRVLEDGQVLRVGASKPRQVDVRIVAATNRVLRTEVAANRFRADLYFRLNVIPVRIPPLRERPEDILPLARHFLLFHSADAGRPLTLSSEAEKSLLAYAWEGNVRELENVIERAVVMSGAEVLTPEAFAFEPFTPEPVEAADGLADMYEPKPGRANETLQECVDRAATLKIKAALDAAKGNRNDAATDLGVDRTTLYRMMKRLNLQ